MPNAIRPPRPAFLALLLVPLVAALVLLLPGGTRTEAQTGQYLHFPGPGTGHMAVDNDAALNPTSAITIEAWVYLTDYEPYTVSDCPTVVGKGYQTSYWLGICNGFPTAYMNNGAVVLGAVQVPLLQWTHVAVTYDTSDLYLYINGVAGPVSNALSGAVGTNPSELRIGSDVDWDKSPKGAIDEVRLWSVERTQGEIAGAMNAPITSATAGLIASWNMEGTVDSSVGTFAEALVPDVEFRSGTVPTLTPSPSPTPSASPIQSETPTSSASPTITASPSPSPTTTGSITPAPTTPGVITGTPASATPASDTPTATPTPVFSDTPTVTPIPTVTPTSTPTPSPAPTPPPTLTPGPGQAVQGDGDCNGILEAADIIPYLNYQGGLGPSPGPCGTNTVNGADINCDGFVDAVDALLLLQHLAGIQVALPLGCPGIGTIVGP